VSGDPDLPAVPPAVAPPASGAVPWAELRQLTAARIGLASSGAGLATAPLLDFRLAHAAARDAAHDELDCVGLAADLAALAPGVPAEVVCVASRAADRRTYLLRPDLGRALDLASAAALAQHAGRYDLAIAVADGLSARAVEMHAAPVLAEALPPLRDAGWRIAPVVVVRQGRVAIGDAIAVALGAAAVVVLIGERPGLSAPYSVGAYLTWDPGPTRTDADRNCISNIRPEGIGYREAADKLVYLLRQMRARGGSGVGLKDESNQAGMLR
jgi:ethanolamine ammonia-lyase small subunit